MSKSKETYLKRQKQQQRTKRKEEKREKQALRKENAETGKPLEAMLAFVDENGNLTDTPPDTGIMKLIK